MLRDDDYPGMSLGQKRDREDSEVILVWLAVAFSIFVVLCAGAFILIRNGAIR